MALNQVVWLASIQSEAMVRRSTSQATAPWATSGPSVARMTASCSSSSSTVMAPRSPCTV